MANLLILSIYNLNEPNDYLIELLIYKWTSPISRNIEKALGSGIKKPSPSELKNKPIARKSIVAAISFGIHPVTAGRCAEKGKKRIDNYEGILDILKRGI